MDSKRVTVTTAATLVADQGGKVAPLKVLLRNPGAASIDIGGSTVVTGAGFELAAGASASFDLATGDKLYGVVASATGVVEVLETSEESGD